MVEDLSPGSHDKINVKCDYCGKVCLVVWRDYYLSIKNSNKYACKNCKLKKISDNTLLTRRNDLYNRAKLFCDECGYTLLTKEEDIKDSSTRVDYECPKHGVHNTKIYTLITRHKCIDCMHEYVTNLQKLLIDDIIEYVEAHDSKWLNPEDYTRSTDKNMRVVCPECGQEFVTSFFAYRKYDGQYCPECMNLESKGEKKVRKFLEDNKISFISQYRFHDCRTSVPLPFDFYLEDENILIEYDGEGHYIPIKRGKMTDLDAEIALKNIQARDTIKTNYCKNNNILLIRIPYWDYNNIENILLQKLKITR